ncbi:hypothetical protein COU00_00160 [Candidatus Falkowbacteria bacterium CG10_big_fil_rev_8_21_14_0_10_43_11]|uniref:DUF4258 domain-containing protein n=1 Tax=Candidatus Falkowbacteria bacterium CG10_big_fil_rev_8_21_14_0_10_43_11 TaxID=1974568 RepID=A0A2M6WN47_9BACT|nr:MAG: hypothetical protein COU00_00160 [Candidatus Falkowbacteria bacterium CG10_big_fil_rev_8_21_14_0_10_43_11]
MIQFTKYANDKFEILNKYKVFITKEQIEEVLRLPDATRRKGKYLICAKGKLAAVLKIEDGINKVVTFYPTK